MVNQRGNRFTLWHILAINFFIFIAFTSANPQRRRGGGGRGFAPGRSNSNANEIVFSVNNQPEITVPLVNLTRDTHLLYYPVQFPEEVETARVVRGPPDVGFFFLSPDDDSSAFASKTMYAPGASARYPDASDTLTEPFGYVGYIAFFLFPRQADPTHFMAALALTTDETGPSSGDTDFLLLFFDFTKPEYRGKLTGDLFPERVTIEKAALVHAPDLHSRVTIYNAQKTDYTTVAPHYEMLIPFEGAKYVSAAESPPPGPIPLPRELS